MQCSTCRQNIDPGGLDIAGRCHGCRVEFMYMKHTARLNTFPARGRNGRALPLTSFERKNRSLVMRELNPRRFNHLAEHHNRLLDRLHIKAKIIPVLPATAKMAQAIIEEKIGSFEDIPLSTLVKP